MIVFIIYFLRKILRMFLNMLILVLNLYLVFGKKLLLLKFFCNYIYGCMKDILKSKILKYLKEKFRN